MYKISDFAEMTGLQNKGVNFVGRAMLKLGSEKSNKLCGRRVHGKSGTRGIDGLNRDPPDRQWSGGFYD